VDGKLTVQSLTLQNGLTGDLGGAIRNAGTLNANSVTFRSNKGANGGAIANMAGATATIFASRFDANAASSVGGAAIINFAELTSRSSTFTNNTAPINGGAINTQPGGITTIIGGLFTGDTAGSLGGALSNLGTLNITAAVIYGNTGSSGGAIATGNDNLQLVGTIIFNNTPDNCDPSSFCSSPYSVGLPHTTTLALSCPPTVSGGDIKSISKSC
jgi:hypothetical protein